MMKRAITSLTLACLVFFGLTPADATTFESQIITDPEKDWTITFNDQVNPSADLHSITIQSATGVKHAASITLSDDSGKIIVKPTKPYLFGTTYSLVIPKGFESAKGNKLRDDVTKQFTMQGEYIQDIKATLNPFLTVVNVQGSADIAETTVSINGANGNLDMHSVGKQQFSLGLLGLASGDLLTISAYNTQGHLLETQYYEIK